MYESERRSPCLSMKRPIQAELTMLTNVTTMSSSDICGTWNLNCVTSTYRPKEKKICWRPPSSRLSQ